MDEYIVYQSALLSVGEGMLPNVIYEYVKEPLPHVVFTRNLKESYRFYDLPEAEKIAHLLYMQVGRLKLTVTEVKG